jgi:hypothetical protein
MTLFADERGLSPPVGENRLIVVGGLERGADRR